jgi:hypothetical protein
MEVKPGDFVSVWYDAGAGRTGGATILFGVVISAGPKMFSVRWESGIVNRVRYEKPRGVKKVSRSELDRRALRALEGK